MRPGVALSITTKSDLVIRDIDILKQIQKQGSVHVNITITTVKPRLARQLEPKAPTPKRRLAAVKALAEQGIPVGVFIMPVIPLLTDDVESLTRIAKDAKAAGAGYLGARPLFLMPSARKVFLPFIEENFPRLLGAYRKALRVFGLSARGLWIENSKADGFNSFKVQAGCAPARGVYVETLPLSPEQTVFPFSSETQV